MEEKNEVAIVAKKVEAVVSIDESIKYKEELRARIVATQKEDIDYGTIPGTNKPCLFKPGAEKLCSDYNLSPKFEVMESEINHDRENVYEKKEKDPTTGKPFTVEHRSKGLYRYVVKCVMLDRPGNFLGEGVGACSTMEKKFISRPRDMENTVLKMAKKRAFVDIVLTIFGLSGEYTQDMEDQKTSNENIDEEKTKAIELYAALCFDIDTIEDNDKRAKIKKYLTDNKENYQSLIALSDKWENSK